MVSVPLGLRARTAPIDAGGLTQAVCAARTSVNRKVEANCEQDFAAACAGGGALRSASKNSVVFFGFSDILRPTLRGVVLAASILTDELRNYAIGFAIRFE